MNSIHAVCLLVCYCNVVSSLLLQKPYDGESVVTGVSSRERNRRAATAFLSALGKIATEFLLQGTKRLRSGPKNERRFKKPGTLVTAISDFYSVDPRDIRTFRGTNGIIRYEGKIGDRRLSVDSRGERGQPTLEIFNPKLVTHREGTGKPLSGQAIDRIIYRRVDD